MPLPTVSLGNSQTQVTRLISGGNPLVANSHFSEEMDRDMGAYFTPKEIVSYLHAVEAAGINTLQARGDFHRILYWRELFRREGGQLHFIAQTASEMFDVHENIRVISAAGAAGIYLHGSMTDNLWFDGRIDEAEDYLKTMRDAGVQVGLGTHQPEVIEYAEDKGWDIDFYMACFYRLSSGKRESAVVSGVAPEPNAEKFSADAPARMCETIRAATKQCIAYKILGASRCCSTQESVAAAFKFAFDNIKPQDIVNVGMFTKYEDQIALNVAHSLNALGLAV
jgi:hypothetical protein